MGRCDNCQEVWQEVCQLVGRCDGRKCNSHQGGVKYLKNECQLMERCDGHGEGVRGGEL